MKNRLLEDGILTETAESKSNQEISSEIEEAVKFAEESPLPDPSEMSKDVYGPPPVFDEHIPDTSSKTTIGKALNQALREEMTRDDSVFLMGEDMVTTLLDPAAVCGLPQRIFATNFPIGS